MPFFDHYPYTNLHNVNLDWILQKVKEWGIMVEENNTNFINLEAANESFKEYVTHYLENLDLQEEVNTKIDEMFESGALDAFLIPHIKTEVSEWLEENITPTTPPVDATLSIPDAAADAAATGAAIEQIRATMADNNGFNIELDKTLTLPEFLGFRQETSTSGSALFMSDMVIPANAHIDNVRYRVTAAQYITDGMIVIVNADTLAIIDTIRFTNPVEGYNTQTINRTYAAPIMWGLFGANFKFSTVPVDANNTYKVYAYSKGLITTSGAGNPPTIGNTIRLNVSDSGNFYLFKATITFYSADYKSFFDFETIRTNALKALPGLNTKQAWLPYALQRKPQMLPRYIDSNTDIYYYGRWYNQVINGRIVKVCNATGSSIHFKTIGATTVTINFMEVSTSHVYYAFSIDGGEFTRRDYVNNVITLPDDGLHYVYIVMDGINTNISKWDNGAGFSLYDITVNSGHTEGVIPQNPQIMFLGDSIVEGVYALGIPSGTQQTSDTLSATGAFPWFCCQKMNATPFFAGYAISRVLSTSGFGSAMNILKYLYRDVSVPEYCPDAVVIEWGTNDSESGFKEAYKTLVLEVSKMYPAARLYLLIPFNKAFKTEIMEVGEECPWTKVLECDTNGYFNGDKHPDAANAKILGEEIADYILEDIYGVTI